MKATIGLFSLFQGCLAMTLSRSSCDGPMSVESTSTWTAPVTTALSGLSAVSSPSGLSVVSSPSPPTAVSSTATNPAPYTMSTLWASTHPNNTNSSAASACVCPNTNPTVLPPFPDSNNSSSVDDWTGPDWAGMPTNFTPWDVPPSIPSPNDISSPNVIQLVETLQDNLLWQYDTLGALGCFVQGDTVNCQGPWLNPDDWSNGSLPDRIMSNTDSDPGWVCSQDESYLSSEVRVFYGFAAENATDGLESIAHSVSFFASVICTANSSCADAYKNDTAQMYVDFRHFVNETFFASLLELLPSNGSASYCPQGISSPASLLTLPTTPFDGGKEYFGLHDPVFIPGVTSVINGTMEEAKKELSNLLGNNMRSVEGVFLNMVFFTYGSEPGQSMRKRSLDPDEEVYPGCPRRQWIIHGQCEGVIPPREFDLAGTVLPMKERDRLEVIARFAGNPPSSLAVRDACDDMKQSIGNSLLNMQTGKSIFDGLVADVATLSAFAVAIEGLPATAIVTAELLTFGAGFFTVMMSAIAACAAFGNGCHIFPPSLVATAQAVLGKLETAGGLAATVAVLQGVAKVEDVSAALLAGAGLAFAPLFGAVYGTDYILDAAIKYYQGAAACCGSDCSSAVCQQASAGCLLFTGSFFAGSESALNCGAT